MSDNGIVWEDPPNSSRGGARFDGIWITRLQPLTERPGQWARVFESKTPSGAYRAVHGLRRGLYKLPEGSWEYAARNGFVYARYLGPEDAS